MCFLESRPVGVLATCLFVLGHVVLHVLEFGWLLMMFLALCNSTWNSWMEGQRPYTVEMHEAKVQYLDHRLGQLGPPLCV